LDGRPRSASAPAPALHESSFDSSAEDDEPVSLRAEAVAALAMMALKATFTRLRRFEGDSAPVIEGLFTELRTIFKEESARVQHPGLGRRHRSAAQRERSF